MLENLANLGAPFLKKILYTSQIQKYFQRAVYPFFWVYVFVFKTLNLIQNFIPPTKFLGSAPEYKIEFFLEPPSLKFAGYAPGFKICYFLPFTAIVTSLAR